MSFSICGAGAFSPETVITNDDFAAVMDTSDEWIKTRTGISRRHFAAGTPTYIMALRAAKEAIENAGISPDEIDLVIVSTITADFFSPSVSCLVAGELGLRCQAFDIAAACSGFVYALDTAERYLRTDPDIKYVLVIASEMLTRYIDYSDRASAILFGDGAGAVVIKKGAEDALYSSVLGSDGTGGKYLYGKTDLGDIPFFENKSLLSEDFPGKNYKLIQNGKEVYKFAVKIIPEAVGKAALKAGITVNDITWFIPHQANIRIIETAAKSMDIPLERFIINIGEHGNTSSASIPLALYDGIASGQIKRGDTICLCGFGAGLVYAAMIFKY
jgi:3-oxoacyl-[acyl-carrier-protein] synthase-3